MTTKIISGAYSAGYLLNSKYGTVSITSSGSVGGFGLITQPSTTVDTAGRIAATLGADGVYMQGGGSVSNFAGGVILGGNGNAATQAGAAGQAGGAGVHALAQTYVANSGAIVGGYGGAGATNGGAGGVGGAGVVFKVVGTVVNHATIRGGHGGGGGYNANGAAGASGAGGAGIVLDAGGTIDAVAGSVIGGVGGLGGESPNGGGGEGGAGGAGVILGNGQSFIEAAGGINGGAGGEGVTTGGVGGDGVLMTEGSYAYVETGHIQGGTGGAGGVGIGGFFYDGGIGGDGVDLKTGGELKVASGVVITGGAPGYESTGGSGVYLGAVGTVINAGAIAGGFGAAGVYLHNGGGVVNTGAIGNAQSGIGVDLLNGGATVTNFGTISGFIDALKCNAPGDTLIVEAGCVFGGAVVGGGGTLALGAGTGTLSGIDVSGNVTVTGFMGTSSSTLFQTFGTLEIETGGSFATMTTGTIASGKTLIDNGVLTVGGTLIDNGALTDGGTLTVSGSIGGSGTLTVDGSLTLQTGSALTVGTVYVGAKAAKVTIASNIVEAGLWDQTGGTLTISARKTFELTGGTDYLTGRTTTNRGNLEYAGTGQLFIQNKLVNDSQLIVQSGQITLEAACTVSGAGDAVIKGGTLAADGVFNQNVFFQGAGTLQLGRSQSYTAQVVGFTTTGTDFLDLGDIGFVSAGEATFSGTASGGILTVRDGTHTAHVNLAGNFLTSTFVCASDGHGGVIIHDQQAEASTPPSPHALIAAMSTLGSGSASAVPHTAEPWRGDPASLIAPRCAVA